MNHYIKYVKSQYEKQFNFTKPLDKIKKTDYIYYIIQIFFNIYKLFCIKIRSVLADNDNLYDKSIFFSIIV